MPPITADANPHSTNAPTATAAGEDALFLSSHVTVAAPPATIANAATIQPVARAEPPPRRSRARYPAAPMAVASASRTPALTCAHPSSSALGDCEQSARTIGDARLGANQRSASLPAPRCRRITWLGFDLQLAQLPFVAGESQREVVLRTVKPAVSVGSDEQAAAGGAHFEGAAELPCATV
jgi:hypothetical protein